MQIIRGRLSAADFSPSNLRYNPDTDTVQYTPDGGTTWVDDPADDPRHGAKFAKPLKTSGDVRCDSSASMVKWIRDFITYEAGILTTGAQVVGLANTAFTFFTVLAPWAILVKGIIALAGDLFGVGAIALNSSFTDETYDAMLCCFYCNIHADGTVTAGDLEAIQAQVNTDLGTIAAFVTNAILSAQGEMGLQNAGTLYDVAGDCSGCLCGWCYEFDDAHRLGDWIAETFAGGVATYDGCWQGYPGSTNAIWISWTFDTPVQITTGTLVDWSPDTLNGSIFANGDGGAFTGTNVWANGGGVNPWPDTTSRIDIFLVQAFDPAARELCSARFEGIDENPFGDDNC